MILNYAKIYFDFNSEINTNVVRTDITDNMSPGADVSYASCYGSCDGSIYISSVRNCTPPVKLIWSTGETKNNVISNLCAGEYYLTGDGCRWLSIVDTFQYGTTGRIIIHHWTVSEIPK